MKNAGHPEVLFGCNGGSHVAAIIVKIYLFLCAGSITDALVMIYGFSCLECMKVASGYVPERVCLLLLHVCLCIIASAFTPLGFAESISGAH